MQVFLDNYNGVLDLVEDHLADKGQLTDNPHKADVFLLWQDVRGPQRELSEITKYSLCKPLIVMQHGRGATRDYGPPNKFEMLADKILVWGNSEKDRLFGYGMAQDRVSVVGCPIFSRLLPRVERPGKNILFVPVISTKEEPENILVYAALKRWESNLLIDTISKRFDSLKRAWAWQEDEYNEVKLEDGTSEKRLWKRHVRPILPRWLTYEAGLVNAKLAGTHDMFQYQCPMINTPQNSPNLIDELVNLLANVDVVVSLEEGTLQLLAAAMGLPVIIVDIFRYENYGGCKEYDTVEKIRTNACYWIKDIGKLDSVLNHALKYPKELSKYQKIVCQYEGGIELGDANANIIRELEIAVERSLKKELVAA